MRIAIVSPYDLSVPGGVQAHVQQLAQALSGGGDTVDVIGPRTSVSITFNGSRAPIGLGPRTAGTVRRDLQRLAPDVVHVHEPFVPWVGTTATAYPDAPVVATFHAWSAKDFGYRLARPLTGRLLKRLSGMIAVSQVAAQYHAKALGIPSGRFTVIPNGIDVARFRHAEPLVELEDRNRPTLLFVGRLEPRKGLETLIRAFTRVKSEHPRTRMLIVGQGSERSRCEALLPARLRHDVEFLGKVSADDLPRLYATSDIFVAPALGGESFGIVLLEAMAAGCAVIASDIPGYRGVISHKGLGHLVLPGQPEPLATAINRLIEYPALRESMSADGRRMVDAFDWSRVAGQVRNRYSEALGHE